VLLFGVSRCPNRSTTARTTTSSIHRPARARRRHADGRGQWPDDHFQPAHSEREIQVLGKTILAMNPRSALRSASRRCCRSPTSTTFWRGCFTARPIPTYGYAWASPTKQTAHAARLASITPALHDPYGANEPSNLAPANKLRERYPAAKLHDLTPLIDEMRNIKRPSEIEMIRRAGKLGRRRIEAGHRESQARHDAVRDRGGSGIRLRQGVPKDGRIPRSWARARDREHLALLCQSSQDQPGRRRRLRLLARLHQMTWTSPVPFPSTGIHA